MNDKEQEEKEKEKERQMMKRQMNHREIDLEEENDLEEDEENDARGPPLKKERRDSLEGKTNGSPLGGANIRISSRGMYFQLLYC